MAFKLGFEQWVRFRQAERPHTAAEWGTDTSFSLWERLLHSLRLETHSFIMRKWSLSSVGSCFFGNETGLVLHPFNWNAILCQDIEVVWSTATGSTALEKPKVRTRTRGSSFLGRQASAAAAMSSAILANCSSSPSFCFSFCQMGIIKWESVSRTHRETHQKEPHGTVQWRQPFWGSFHVLPHCQKWTEK